VRMLGAHWACLRADVVTTTPDGLISVERWWDTSLRLLCFFLLTASYRGTAVWQPCLATKICVHGMRVKRLQDMRVACGP
jgi:hypothetical protein